MITEEIRSYEVSLWTLQDEFITVLKWSDAEQKGRIENPEMTLDVDGTENLSFSIPMYINNYDTGETSIMEIKRENPIWYNTLNGNLIEGMRKIKVVFNKMTEFERVYEFLITKITEEHLLNLLICKVDCEGLAFHELGKLGYKFNLSGDNFLLDYESWKETGAWTKADGTTVTTEPKESVDYWCELCLLTPWFNGVLNPNKWYYKIDMNWNTSSLIALDDSSNIITRASTKVYEDSYNTSWDTNLNPLKTETAREKYRAVSTSESNIYNITQTIAETFNIYCRYEYGHDENYHITSRVVIFYNNYFAENRHVLSLTYPYSSKSVIRELDSTELTTKMYVRTDDDDTILGGSINIADSPANKMKEDYLMNFDYMYKHNAITEELYNAIGDYERFMNNINTEINNLYTVISSCEYLEIDVKSLIKVLEESLIVAQELMDTYRAKYNSIDSSDGDQDGYFQRKADNCYSTLAMLDKSSNRYYISFNELDKGIDLSTLGIYKTYTASATTEETKLTNRITIPSANYERDEYGDIIKAYLPANTFASTDYKKVYIVYKYSPKLYYEKVILTWTLKKDNIEDLLNEPETGLRNRLDELESNLETAKENYNNLLAEKQVYIRKFEEMMGPALREGYWQPESYSDYGELKEVISNLPTVYDVTKATEDAGDGAIIYWDTKLFDDEDDIYYEEGVNLDKKYYPCIDISNILSDISNLMNDERGKLALVFNNNYYKDLTNAEKGLILNLSNFTLGGKMHLGFIHIGTQIIKPVLVLTGALTMTDDEIKFMLTAGNPRLCVFNTTVENNNTIVTMSGVGSNSPITVSTNRIYWDASKLSGVQDIISNNNGTIEVAYPRIKFSDLHLKLTSEYLGIYYGNNSTLNILTRYEDYSALIHTTLRNVNGQELAVLEYFVTIKPEVILNAIYKGLLQSINGRVLVRYTLSNAATSIYLDAVKILKENSEPKVSYLVEINVLDKEYLSTLYSTLAQLVIINDVDLKLEEEYGYISNIVLNLDKPWEDSIEVKNYKTKFEDLFSTIVALSEEMKKNSAAFGSAAVGDVALSASALEETLNGEDKKIILLDFFDRMFSSSTTVLEKLRSLFAEAGNILSDATTSLNKVQQLSSENQNILDAFVNKVTNELTANVYTTANLPTIFKVGDIWNKISDASIVARYVATSNSEDANGGGWTRVYDGSIASITGASLDIDAVAGTVDILAKNRINIASNDVDIVGNRSVNIGGTTINIGSMSSGGAVGGINLVATTYSNSNFTSANVAKVIINPEKISLAGSIIEMFTGNSLTGTSALKLDGANGIYVGSTSKIVLYTGNNYSGANVELTPLYLLFGVSNSTSSTTAMEMRPEYIIFSAGNAIGNLRNNNITDSNNIAGVKITNTSIALATGSGVDRSAVIINNNGIIVGAAKSTNTDGTLGSQVTISGSGIDIGTDGNLVVNANSNKFKINANATTTTPNLYIANNGTWDSATLGILYTANGGLEIRGGITATSLYIVSGNTSQSISEYVNSLVSVTDERIWAGLTTYANGTALTNGLLIAPGQVKLSANDTYIDINTNGIQMSGLHIYINGLKEWSRDDIIILKLSDDEQAVIDSMADRGDWVLIKPYYSAVMNYAPSDANALRRTYSLAALTTMSLAGRFTNIDNISFGNGANWYEYALSLSVYAPSGSTGMLNFTVYLANEPLTTSNYGDTAKIVMDFYSSNPSTNTINNRIYLIDNEGFSASRNISTATTRTGTNGQYATAMNLCSENAIIYYLIRCTFSTLRSSVTINDMSLTCVCDATTSKVPCTVYYYPAQNG